MSRLGRFAILNTAGNAFVPLSGAITAPLLAIHLGPIGRGEVAAATSPVLLALTAAGLGLPEAATYFTSKRRQGKKTLWTMWVGIMLGALVSLGLIWIFRFELAGGDPTLASVIILCALSLPLCLATGLLRGIAAGTERWVLVNAERFLTALMRFVAVVGLIAIDNFTVVSASLAIVASQALGGLVYIYLWRTKNMMVAHDPPPASEIYRFAGGAWFGSLAGVLLLRFDQLLMLPLSDSYQLGIYAVAVNVAELMLVGSNAIRDVMFSAESTRPNARRIVLASKISFFGTLGLTIIGITFCILFLPVLFGSEFAPSTYLFAIMAVGFTIGAPGSIAGAGLASRGVPHLRSLSLTGAAILNVALVLWLVPLMGSLGAALATAICAAVGGLTNQSLYSRRFGISGVSAFWLTHRDICEVHYAFRKKGKVFEEQKAD